MVKWSEFILSGSLVSGSTGRTFDVFERAETARKLWAVPTPPIKPEPKQVIVNEEYVKRINEIKILALNFGICVSDDVFQKILDVQAVFTETGILTKEEMIFLNGVYKLLSFEAKYHPDKQTTLGRITDLLGGFNGKQD